MDFAYHRSLKKTLKGCQEWLACPSSQAKPAKHPHTCRNRLLADSLWAVQVEAHLHRDHPHFRQSRRPHKEVR